jgi:hypothetical protein
MTKTDLGVLVGSVLRHLLLCRPTPPLYIDSKPADASLVKVDACPLSLVYARAC